MRTLTTCVMSVACAVAILGTTAYAHRADTSVLQQKPKTDQQPPIKETPPPPEPPPTGSIKGRITSLADGLPIERARVVLSANEIFACPPNTPVERQADCPRYNRVELTDADGRYTFDKLPRGVTFVVTAQKTGYAARAYGETPPAVNPAFIALKSDEHKESVDIQLVKQNYITGVLTDEDGTAFGGALVEALRAIYENGQRKFVTVAESVTDEHGNFRLFGLPPGQYFVSAFDPSYARVGDTLGQLFYGPTFYPGTPYQDDAARVTLDPGHPIEGLKFSLKIIRPARVSGKISSTGLLLLAGAINIGPLRNSKIASFAISEADIRPDGLFQFANILAGRYRISARGEVERQGRSYFTQYAQPIMGTDISDITLNLSPGAIVNGRITWDGRSTPPPADQSLIRVRAPMVDGSVFGDALTGRILDGQDFSLRGVMAGQHLIRIEGLPEPWRLKKVLFKGSDVTDVPIEMEYRDTLDGVEIILTDQFMSVAGQVRTAQNDTPQGYAVIVFPVSTLNWTPGSRFVKLTYALDSGEFHFRGLPPGEYYAAVTREFDESDLGNPDVLDRLSQTATTFRLAEGDRRRLVLDAVIPRRSIRTPIQ